MALAIAEINNYLPHFNSDLLEAIAQEGMIKEVPAGVEILKEGQYIKVIPIVLEEVELL